jgi:hypothetical protein
MSSITPLGICGRRRSPATLAGFHQGRPPRNKGLRYPPDPPTVREIIAVMRAAGDNPEGIRLRGGIVVLWRAGCGSAKRWRLPRAIWIRAVARCWCAAVRAATAARSGWTAGDGSILRPGVSSAPASRPGRCSACCAAPLVAVPAHPRGSARNFARQLRLRACAAGSRPTSSGTPTRWRCLGRGSRCWSSSASSGIMRTLGSPQPIYGNRKH